MSCQACWWDHRDLCLARYDEASDVALPAAYFPLRGSLGPNDPKEILLASEVSSLSSYYATVNLDGCSDYKRVPPLRRDDNIMPSASDIPSMLSAFRNPRQRRVSIGPQSEADAREFLANREKQRRDRSASSPRRRQARKVPTTNSDASSPSLVEHTTSYPLTRQTLDYDVDHAASISGKAISKASLQTDAPNRNLLTPPASDAGGSSDSGKEDERHDKAMFLALIKPRTHYDVEVITKLVVYVGEFESLCSYLTMV